MRAMLKSLLVCLACLGVTLNAGAAAPIDVKTSERIVAFGDVHGAYDDWVAMLRELGLVDASNNWTGGKTHLVSLGDLIDRGPGSREVIELMMKLEKQAASAGGAVHMVLGNHEVMVLTGDLRYVSGPEFAAYASDESEADRDRHFAEYRRYNPGSDEPTVRAQFDQDYPRGYFAMKAAFAPDGAVGSWLLSKPFVLKLNDRVFIHAGVSYDLSGESLKSMNKKVHDELEEYLDTLTKLEQAGVMPRHVDQGDRLNFLNARAEEFAAANPGVRADWFDPLTRMFEFQESLLFAQDAPHWYRGTAICHPYAESYNTERFLKKVGARQMVVGHTPSRGDVIERMDGLAIRLDTGMLHSHYKGRAAALITEGGNTWVHYSGSDVRAQPTPELRDLSLQLSGMNDTALEDFMRTAPIVNIEDIGTGISKPKRVTLSNDGTTLDAVFKYEDTHPGIERRKSYNDRRNNDADRYQFDVAAYKLDRMLDWQMVPVSVLRSVDDDDGVLGYWIKNAINERDRLEEEVPFNSYCPKNEQYRLRFVFDILIYNEDRNLTNILWTKKDFMMKFIDHSLAFRSTEKRPKQYRKVTLEVSDLLREQLESLTVESVTEELGPWLHPKQIEAILARRDLILKEARSSGR